MDNATRVQVLCEACDFFFVLIRLFPLNFGNFFFAYGQRYALEISTTKGVIDHADSEYAVFIDREHFLQNRSGVICNYRRFKISTVSSNQLQCDYDGRRLFKITFVLQKSID
jgi:hypothetical protein